MQVTADRNVGRCAPCHRQAIATPPDDYLLPQDVCERLSQLGEDPSRFRQIAWQNGIPFVYGYLNKLLERDALFVQWAPQLRAFAAQCRVDSPPPSPKSLPPRDLAKLPIYESKIQSAERVPIRDGSEVRICCLPAIGIPIARRCWPGEDERSVFLTPEECLRWQKLYEHPATSFWWFVEYWWKIEDPLKRDSPWMERQTVTIPEGEEAWLVESGLSWGSLAGGAELELWAWNGIEARFIEEIAQVDF